MAANCSTMTTEVDSMASAKGSSWVRRQFRPVQVYLVVPAVSTMLVNRLSQS